MATPVAEGPSYRRRGGYRRVDHVVTEDLTIAFRVIAAIAAAALIVFGLVALARINWDGAGLDAEAVEVADITFTPVVAIAVGVAGLLALLAAATRDRTSKIVVGALLVCAGIAAFIAEPDSDRVILEDAHGWLMVVVGGVLVAAALAMSWQASRRVVETDAV
jgi:uncharacterized membrane protein YidH (DUF202 family)